MIEGTKHGFLERMVGASRLDPSIYEEVEADRTATPQALGVVVLVAVATGISSLSAGIGGLLFGVVGALIGWATWAGITYLIGTKVLAEPATHADWGELARALGFAQSPGLLKVLGLLPGVGGVIFLAASVWQLCAMVIAVRQALDYSSTRRAVGVVALGFIPYVLLMVVAARILHLG